MSVHIFPAISPDGSSLHWSYAVAAGRSAALFAVLAGVGLALATGGQEPYDGRRLSATVAPALSHVVRMHLDIAPIDEPGGSDLFAELLLTGTCPVLPWTTYLFVGLALGRLDLRRRATARRRRSGTRRRGEARVVNPARCSGGSGPAAGLRVAGLRVRLPGG